MRAIIQTTVNQPPFIKLLFFLLLVSYTSFSFAQCPIPDNVRATNITETSISLSWDLVPEATEGYLIEYAIFPSGPSLSISTSDNFVTIEGLLPNTGYDLSVQSFCFGGILSGYTNPIRGITSLLCTVPYNLGANTVTQNSANLTWSVDAGASSYTLHYRPTEPTGGTWTTVSNAENPYPLSGLNLGTDYEFQVQSNCGASSSLFSDETYRFSTVSNAPYAQIKVLLEGPYNSSSNLMRTDLSSGGLLPLAQPYTIAPWNYNGNEQAFSFSSDVVDWVIVELRDPSNTGTVIVEKAALLLADGTVQDPLSADRIYFDGASPGSYKIVVRHRNHLDILSANTINIPNDAVYDFSNVANVADGAVQLATLESGVYGMRAGDFDGGGALTVSDYNLYSTQTATINQYIIGDCTLDKSVTVADFNAYQPNTSIIGVSDIRY